VLHCAVLCCTLCAWCAAMCSNYMARLDVAIEEWFSCEGPRLSRLHAGVAGTAGALACGAPDVAATSLLFVPVGCELCRSLSVWGS
jgi:hypothetical protein